MYDVPHVNAGQRTSADHQNLLIDAVGAVAAHADTLHPDRAGQVDIPAAVRLVQLLDEVDPAGDPAAPTPQAGSGVYSFRMVRRAGAGWEAQPTGLTSEKAKRYARPVLPMKGLPTGESTEPVLLLTTLSSGKPEYVFAVPGRLHVALCKVSDDTADDAGGYTTTGATECSNADNYGGPSTDTTKEAKDPASCGYLYEVYALDATTRLDDPDGGGLTPKKPRVAAVEYYKPSDYSPCLVYYDASGALQLLEAIEERPKGYTGTKQSYRAQWVSGADGTDRLVNEVWDEVFADGLLVGRYQRCNELVVDGDPECDTP